MAQRPPSAQKASILKSQKTCTPAELATGDIPQDGGKERVSQFTFKWLNPNHACSQCSITWCHTSYVILMAVPVLIIANCYCPWRVMQQDAKIKASLSVGHCCVPLILNETDSKILPQLHTFGEYNPSMLTLINYWRLYSGMQMQIRISRQRHFVTSVTFGQKRTQMGVTVQASDWKGLTSHILVTGTSATTRQEYPPDHWK